MPGPRTLLLAPCFALALSAGTARADPPPGWEAPPQLPARAGKAPSTRVGKLGLAACCAYDERCCSRQMEIERARPDRVGRLVEVRFADLPELVVKKVADGDPPIPGAPGVRIVDGQGRPAPWPDKPKLEVRVMPLGRYGAIFWNDGWDEPFFSAPEYRGMGYGLVHVVSQETAAAKDLLTGKVVFTSLDKGSGDSITVDYVKGVLKGTPALEVALWGHVDAAPVTGGFVHAFRGAPPSEGRSGEAPPYPSPAVTFVLPEVILGFESLDTKHVGGFLRVRGSSDVAFTTFTLPVGPGRSGLASFEVLDNEVARWFPRPAGAPKLPEVTRMALSSSQTSVEAQPHVRVIVFAD